MRPVVILWLVCLGIWIGARAWLSAEGVGWATYYGGLNLILVAGAVIILRSDLQYLLRPARSLYAPGIAGWKWGRVWLILPIAAIFWGGPLILTVVFGDGVNLRHAVLGVPLSFVALQLLLVGPAQELFFREAAIKASGGSAFVCAALAVVVFGAVEWQVASFPMWIAAGSGAVYLSARLAGVPVLVVGLFHGLTNLVIGGIQWPALGAPFIFPVLYLAICLGLALAVLSLWAGKTAGRTD